MKINTAVAALNWSRHCLRAVRSLNPMGVIAVALVLVFGGVGIAAAQTGGNFILGKENDETSEAYLNNSNGVPLKLVAPANVAPLRVSNPMMVSNLNAQFVGGQTASDLESSGGNGATGPTTPINNSVGSSGQKGADVAFTGGLPAGEYYVTATALLNIVTGDGYGYCYIALSPSPGVALQLGGASISGEFTAAETIALSVPQGDALQEWCYSGGNNGSFVYNAGINAIKITNLYSVAAKGARIGLHGDPTPRGR